MLQNVKINKEKLPQAFMQIGFEFEFEFIYLITVKKPAIS